MRHRATRRDGFVGLKCSVSALSEDPKSGENGVAVHVGGAFETISTRETTNYGVWLSEWARNRRIERLRRSLIRPNSRTSDQAEPAHGSGVWVM